MTTTAAPIAAPTVLEQYRSLWRLLPRELGFHALSFPLAVTSFGITIGLFSAGLGSLAVFFIGVFFIIAALYVARGFGTIELVRLGWAGRPAISQPAWNTYPGFWGWMRSTLGEPRYWLYLLHIMIIGFIVSTVTWSIMITWISVALSGLTYWFWNLLFLQSSSDWHLSEWLFGTTNLAAPAAVLDAIAFFLLGVVATLTLPLVSRVLVLLHDVTAQVLLGSSTTAALRQQVGDLTASRGAAIATEGHSLRRLERDIHDGPQQRLVRLQMDIAAAERQLDSDPVKARVLLSGAMDQSREALEELRALSRGFAPPLLLDRGLLAAVESAAGRSPVPVVVAAELGDHTLGTDLERNAYFVVSEALANVAKHSRATEATVNLGITIDAENRRWLEIAVHDNGRGGALAMTGHGLAGLTERVRGFGGTLEITSPVGGPTTVLARVPVPVPVPVAESSTTTA